VEVHPFGRDDESAIDAVESAVAGAGTARGEGEK
jgi:hypothetical protein